MHCRLRKAIVVVSILSALPRASAAQDIDYFVGALAGVATLSGDPSSVVTTDGFAVSMYKPENGPSVNLLLGAHLREFVSVQANYIWNRNDMTLFSALATGESNRFYQQPRTSSQHALVGDVLVYFRERASRVRPYLSGGLGVVRLESARDGTPIDAGLSAPAPSFTSTDIMLRVAVGVDVPVGQGWGIRYSFSESIGPNPISSQLDPPGTRGLMNFQNLVGVIRAF